MFACRVRPLFTTYEGTADTQTRRHLGDSREPVFFGQCSAPLARCTARRMLALESPAENACVARNIKNAYMAEHVTYTVRSHPAFAEVGLASEMLEHQPGRDRPGSDLRPVRL